MPSVPARLAALLVACALGLAAGCGSDDPKTFDEDGFAITFEYPGDFERTTDISTQRGVGQAEESVALAMSEDNAIFVQRYGLNKPVTPGDADAVKVELDRVLSRLAGTDVTGRRIDVGGPIAFRYEVDQLAGAGGRPQHDRGRLRRRQGVLHQLPVGAGRARGARRGL